MIRSVAEGDRRHSRRCPALDFMVCFLHGENLTAQ